MSYPDISLTNSSWLTCHFTLHYTLALYGNYLRSWTRREKLVCELFCLPQKMNISLLRIISIYLSV